MENRMDELFEKLKEMAENRQYRELRERLLDMNEVDVAAFLEELPSEKVTAIFRLLPKEIGADVFSNLSTEIQEEIVNSVTDQELSYIVEELYVDDAVDLLEELPANVVKRVLKNATPDTRNLINQFLNYKENSAGSIMTAEFVDLRRTMTVKEAIAHIRHTGLDKETVYTCYVIDKNRILDGVVSVKDLLVSSDETSIEDIMETDIIAANTDDDQEEVVQLFHKYNLESLPVVDRENRLVGIVTVDDVVDVMEQEATEDFEKMAAMLPSEKPYLKTSVFTLAKNRIVWLLILMVSAMITGGIITRFQNAVAALPLLVTFMPMLTDTGGNAGSQSATMIIRGMAVNEIASRDFFRVLWKELRVGVLVAIVLSVINYLRVILTYPGNKMIALTISLSLFIIVVLSKAIGSTLPMLAKMLKLDPAIMASPLVTTIVDAVGLMFYFSLAQRLLL